MQTRRWGIFLIIIGALGLVAWSFGADMLFQYLVTEVYNGDPGEPIWVLAPEYVLLALIPTSFLLFGSCALLFSTVPSSRHS